jgi:hypothetical protein
MMATTVPTDGAGGGREQVMRGWWRRLRDIHRRSRRRKARLLEKGTRKRNRRRDRRNRGGTDWDDIARYADPSD